MKFKDEEMKVQFWKLDPKLRLMLCDLENYALAMYGKEIVITDLLRPTDKTSVHFYGRGADVRSWMFNDVQIAEMKFYISQKYPYQGGKKPTFLYHRVGDGVHHIHIQTEATQEWDKVRGLDNV